MDMKIGGKVKNIRLNNHSVSVITPKRIVSYDEGTRNVERIIKEIKKK